jgi:hypothetical protein
MGTLGRCGRRSIGEPQHGLARRSLSTLDRVAAAAARRKRPREMLSGGLQPSQRDVEPVPLRSGQTSKEFAVRGILVSSGVLATSGPVKARQRYGIEKGAPFARLAKLAATAQQQGTQADRDDEPQQQRELDHNPTPYVRYLQSATERIADCVPIERGLPHNKSITYIIRS